MCEFLDLERTQVFSPLQPFASLFYHLMSQIEIGVISLRMNGSVEPLLSRHDGFIDTEQGAMWVRSQDWVVNFGHGTSS